MIEHAAQGKFALGDSIAQIVDEAFSEKLYIIEGFTFDGLLIYTKGVIRREFGEETLYILVSAKRSI